MESQNPLAQIPDRLGQLDSETLRVLSAALQCRSDGAQRPAGGEHTLELNLRCYATKIVEPEVGDPLEDIPEKPEWLKHELIAEIYTHWQYWYQIRRDSGGKAYVVIRQYKKD